MCAAITRPICVISSTKNNYVLLICHIYNHTFGALETKIDQIFSIDMFIFRIISRIVLNPCCADTMLSIVVWFEPVQITILSCFSGLLVSLANSIVATKKNKKAAIAWPIHSLHDKIYAARKSRCALNLLHFDEWSTWTYL